MRSLLYSTQVVSLLFAFALTSTAQAQNQNHLHVYTKRDSQGDVVSLSRSDPVQAAKLVQQFPGLANNVSLPIRLAVHCRRFTQL